MSDIKVSKSETMLEERVPPTPQNSDEVTPPSGDKIQNYPAEKKVRKKTERKRRKRNSKVASSAAMSDDTSVHISAWQIILTKVMRIHHSQVSAKVLFHEVADVLERFYSLVQDSCTVIAKNSNHQGTYYVLLIPGKLFPTGSGLLPKS